MSGWCTRPSIIAATPGRINTVNRECIVSWSASVGVEAWDLLISSRVYSWACVWTGDENSPRSEWYDPWVVNVEKARAAGMLLIFCHPDSGPDDIGKGQTVEKEYLEGKGYAFTLKPISEVLRLFRSEAGGIAGPLATLCRQPDAPAAADALSKLAVCAFDDKKQDQIRKQGGIKLTLAALRSPRRGGRA